MTRKQAKRALRRGQRVALIQTTATKGFEWEAWIDSATEKMMVPGRAGGVIIAPEGRYERIE